MLYLKVVLHADRILIWVSAGSREACLLLFLWRLVESWPKQIEIEKSQLQPGLNQ